MRTRTRAKTSDMIETAATKPRKPSANRRIKRKPKPSIDKNRFLPSGSTLLNLACTNTPYGAFETGKYIYFVGDSTSGKTFVSMSCFAEATIHPFFKNYRLIYDNVEDGMLIDLEKMFSKTVAERVEPPPSATNEQASSEKVEEFYYNVDDAVIRSREDGRPFIYVLDSMDALTSESEEGKFDEHKTAHRAGKAAPGSYGDGKAKKNSENIRKVQKGLRETKSILVIISQTRDNIGSSFGGKTRSGGRALKFYATHEVWTSVDSQITKTVRGKKRNIGIVSKVQVKKNRVTGEKHDVTMSIYPSYGIDDIGACIDYLLSEKWWTVRKQTILATEFGVECIREKLIQHIEENNEHRRLQTITGKCWNEIREASKLQRRKKYGDE